MSDLSNNLFETIDSLVSRRIDSTPIDTTITGEIATLRNVEVGEYKVTYQGNTFSAFSLDPMTVYKSGEEVYVLVPKGDFSSKKIILGKAAFNDKVSYTDRQAMANQWRPRGANWLSPEMYWRNTDGTFRTDERKGGIVVSNQEDDENIVHPAANWRDYIFYRDGIPDSMEQNYTATRKNKTRLPDQRPATTEGGIAALERADHEVQLGSRDLSHIMVRADFETSFLSSHSSGEYGVQIECFIDNPQWGQAGHEDAPQYLIRTFQLGFGDFNGARYSFAQPTPQWVVFPVEANSIRGLSRVSLFQTDGWKTDIQPVSINPATGELDENGRGFTFELPLAKKVLDKNNVIASNVEIYWCEKINLEQRLFWIKVDAIKGTSLYSTPGSPEQEASWITSVPLRARLMYGSQDITSKETCKFVWFRQKHSALRSLAEGTEEDEFGNTWGHYLPEGENGWAPIAQMIKSPDEDPALGENATYKLGVLNNSTFVEDRNFQNTLLVPIAEVPWQWKYMVVCYYNPSGGALEEIQRNRINDALVWDTETVRNASSIHDFELPMAMVGRNLADILLRVRNNTLPWQEDILFNPHNPEENDPQRDWYCRWWWVAGQAYNAMEVDNDPDQQRYHKGARRVDHLLLNEPITFKAQIYGKRNPSGSTPQEQVGDAAQLWPDPPAGGIPDMSAEYGEYEIANLERTISPTDGAAVHVEFIGQRTHYYNSNGKIRLASAANTQFNIRAKITPRDDSISIFGVDWLAPDRTPLSTLSASEVIAGRGYTPTPQDSLLRDMWMNIPNNGFDQRSFHYKIEDTFDKDKADPSRNTVILQIRFTNGTVQEVPCVINFVKSDENGAQGSDWTAQIWPCNATPTLDGINAVGYSPWSLMIQEHPRPLVVNGNSSPETVPTSGYTRNNDFNLFLRPFIKKDGVAIEALPEKYTYKVFWDVRYPAVKAESSPRADASYGSFLEISQANVSGRADTDLGKDGSLATGTPYLRGKTLPEGLNNLQAFSHSLDREGAPYQGVPNGTSQPTFGAVQIRWANRPNVGGRSFKELGYSFVVKARIEIYNKDGTGVASITSFHGVDVLFTNGSTITPATFKPSMIKTNWPKDILYSTNGMAPTLINRDLSFLYGDSQYLASTGEPFPMTAVPENLTPNIQSLNLDTEGLNVRGPYDSTKVYGRTDGEDGKADVVSYEGFYFAVKEVGELPVGTAPDRFGKDPNWRQINDLTKWKLIPAPYYFFERMDNGALATDIKTNTGKWPEGATSNPDFATWRDAVFVRPIVYYISQFGNDSINGWDGKNIDINEENGTIFAPTIGAGWKHPFTNTFSGVIMGIDTAQLKSTYEPGYGGFSEDNQSQNPYMTGLYGYQDGHNSFGIMENGTAFFGRADRGGRIIIDGYNAQIYGGTSIESRVGLDADMRNRMRLSFIDFGGVANQMNLDDPNLVGQSYSYNTIAANYNAYVEGINWDDYHKNKTYRTSVDLQLETYRSQMNSISNGATPGLPVGDAGGIALGSFPVDQTLDTGFAPAKDRWFGDFNNYFAPGWGSAPNDPGLNPYAARYGGYFTGNSYSTPAIEIGSYEDWMKDANGYRRVYTQDEKAWVRDNYQYHRGSDLIRHYTIKHVQSGGAYNNISSLEIPGFRRFLVTYDGTLYAMNAFIKGNIVGSNIIGSQFFNANGSYAVTEDGNLGIGKGYGSWSEDKVQSGYSQKWSKNIPETKPWSMEEYLPTEQNQKKDFVDGGFGFYVSNSGVVICKEIHIAGGSINIGDFHVIGKADGDFYKGDVVSFGTMYLVGRKGEMPSLGDVALEAWGDFNLRGRLVNLGPVYLGGKTEKQKPGSSINGSSSSVTPTSFNSPVSVTPDTFSPGTDNADPNLPVRIGVWPLYFKSGSITDYTSNNSWVTLAGNNSTSEPTVGANNGYMPVFSWRPGSDSSDGPAFASGGYDRGNGVLAQHVFWRLDQLAMWSDGIVFTKKSWTGYPSDDAPLSFGTHGLFYQGWWKMPTQGGGSVWSFMSKNVSRSAPVSAIEAPAVIRLTAGLDDTMRGSASSAIGDEVSKIILQTVKRGGARTGGLIVLDSTDATKDFASISGSSIAITGRKDTRGATFSEDDINAFISVNAISFKDNTRQVLDELGNVVDHMPRYTPGSVWIKGRSLAIDGAKTDAGVNGADGVYNTTVRLNRTWYGSDEQGNPDTSAMPVGIGDSTGAEFLGLASSTIMVRARGTADGSDDGCIHIVSGGTDNYGQTCEILLTGVDKGGLLRFNAATELSLGVDMAGHNRPTKGIYMLRDKLEVVAYPAEEQVGIYARFA